MGIFKKCTVTCNTTRKMDFVALKQLKFLAGQNDVGFFFSLRFYLVLM